MQDLLVAGGTQLLTDEVLRSALGYLGEGMYGIYAQEEQVMNMITMSAPPAGSVPIRTLRVIHSISRQRQFLSLRSNSPLSSVKPNKGSSSVGAVAPQEQSSAPNVASPFRRSSIPIGIRNKKRTNKKII